MPLLPRFLFSLAWACFSRGQVQSKDRWHLCPWRGWGRCWPCLLPLAPVACLSARAELGCVVLTRPQWLWPEPSSGVRPDEDQGGEHSSPLCCLRGLGAGGLLQTLGGTYRGDPRADLSSAPVAHPPHVRPLCSCPGACPRLTGPQRQGTGAMSPTTVVSLQRLQPGLTKAGPSPPQVSFHSCLLVLLPPW